MNETIPDRVERISHDYNISKKEALRVALAESRLERKKVLLNAAIARNQKVGEH
jgi:hypothetical protein